MTEATRSRLVYVDANPIAYAFEGPQELAVALKDLFSIFRLKRGSAVTSELTLAEVLPKRKVPDRQFLDLLIWSEIFDLRPVTRNILVDTADYRRITRTRRPDGQTTMPKLPDAIHVVTAIQSGCSFFLSSDVRIKLPNTITLINADQAGIAKLIQELA
jgi:predicted nucleic acid-binding protein